MKTDKINIQTTQFRSKLAPNNILKQSFDKAYAESDRYFLQSVKAIMNDGKEDLIELKYGNHSNIDLIVNNKKESEKQLNYYSNAGITLIREFAEKIFGRKTSGFKYADLTKEERELISSDALSIRLSAKHYDTDVYFMENIQNNLNRMKQKIDEHTKQELVKIQKLIFQK